MAGARGRQVSRRTRIAWRHGAPLPSVSRHLTAHSFENTSLLPSPPAATDFELTNAGSASDSALDHEANCHAAHRSSGELDCGKNFHFDADFSCIENYFPYSA